MRRNALLLVAVMLVQVALPMQAGAQTNPPTSPGNWTIASGDTTYYNNSQRRNGLLECQRPGIGSRTRESVRDAHHRWWKFVCMGLF